ncbi:MAG TPA: hypothetical protein VG710_09910 [Opitutus sp.]|nr:hypothetical protein [Opitutus sp.]
MKIAFLCSSLAPGRDGVGDYTRQLATACGGLGHVCLLVALHDRHTPPAAGVIERPNEVRLSSTLPWPRRAELLAELFRQFDPHWLSWQLVPYGFHAKGILPPGCFRLLEAARPWHNHVMLHELWLGLADRDPLQSRLIGTVQRAKLLTFLRRLRPACLHTTNPAYQIALARAGWPAELLPLFGNIPIAPASPDLAREELLALAGLPARLNPRVAILFGTIHPQWQPEPTLHWLRCAAAHSERPVALLSLGHCGPHGSRLLARLAHANPEIPIVTGGVQPPDKLSRLLQAADFAIATHPWALIEKSGSTATLLEHGLPVLVPRDEWRPRHGTFACARDSLLRRLDDLSPAALDAWLAGRRPPASRLPDIAARFTAHLSSPAPEGALVA